MEKFDVSSNGILFIGSAGGNLTVCKMEDSVARVTGSRPREQLPHKKVRVLRNGTLLSLDGLNHDSIILDEKLNALTTLKGTPLPASWSSYAHTYSKLSSSDFSGEEDVILLPTGPNTSSFMDSASLVQKDLAGLWLGPANTYAFGLVAVPSHDLKKVAGLGLSDSHQTLHLWDSSSGAVVLGSMYCASLTHSKDGLTSSASSPFSSLFIRFETNIPRRRH